MGGCYSQEKIDESLKSIDSLYIGEGWYIDGASQAMDYYIPFAFHYYALLYTVIDPDASVAGCFQKRACQFAKQFLLWSSSDGSCVPYGRSLTYRFAMCAFWSALAFCDLWPYEKGVVKGIILRHFRWWHEKPIVDNAGILTVGYAYQNALMSEQYNAWGSPYWAFKAFLVLALEKTDDFWEVQEQPLPALETVSYQNKPGYALAADPHRNQVVLFPNRPVHNETLAHYESKYMKFAYSSYFGFSVRKGLYTFEQSGCDATLAVSTDGSIFVPRSEIISSTIENGVLTSVWKPVPEAQITSYVIPGVPWHIRVHEIRCERPLYIRDAGYAIEDNKVTVEKEELSVFCKAGKARSGAVCLTGAGVSGISIMSPNTNLIHPQVKVPFIQYRLPKGRFIIAAAFYGAVQDENTDRQAPVCEVGKHSVRIKADGNVYELKLHSKPLPKTLVNTALLKARRIARIYKGV